jgi:hypothetical protein
MRPLARLFAIVAAALWLGTGIASSAEGSLVLQTPTGLSPGDSFRFVFVTAGIRDATSTNIADYDSFVNAEAGGATYNGLVVDWLAVASTDSADAIDHIGQSSTPVYLSDGTLVATTTTPEGLWSGSILHAIDLDLAGNPADPVFFVWTGTNPSGTGFGGALGTATPQTGSSTDSDGAWISSGRSPSGDLRNLYGISTVLTVPTEVDTDADGIADSADNCQLVANTDQRDTNGDGFGNVCDADLDNDCAINFVDLGLMKSVFFGADADADLDGNGSVNFVDLGLMKGMYFQPPGPSGVTNACAEGAADPR